MRKRNISRISKYKYVKFTCSVVICLSLNLSSTYRRATEVLPTHPSPSKTTLKLYPVPTTGLAIIPEEQLNKVWL